MTKLLKVKFTNGETWGIPVSAIIDDMRNYYKEEFDAPSVDREDIEDWAQNNMNWVDVKDFAIKLAHKVDYQDLWIEADFLGVDDE